MSVTTFNGTLWLPNPTSWGPSGTPGFSTSLQINAAGDKAAIIVAAPKAGTLDWFELELTAKSVANPAGAQFSFQTIDPTTGLPDGVVDEFRVITPTAVGWIVPPGVMTSDGTNSGTKRTVTAGEILGLVVDYSTFTAGDSLSWRMGWSNAVTMDNLAYVGDGNTGTYGKSAIPPCSFALKYSDGTYATFPYFAEVPVRVVNAQSYASNSDPDERGMRFTVPLPYVLSHVWIRADLDADADLVVYDNANNILTSITLDTDIRAQTSGQNFIVTLPTAITLTVGAVYRVTLLPTTTTAVIVYDMDASTNALIGAFPGGASWYRTTRKDAGAWTDTNTNRPVMGLGFTGVETSVLNPVEVAHTFVGVF